MSDGATGDGFGKAVALSEDTALIGAPGDDDLGTDSGSASVFVRIGATWSFQQKLLATDGALGDAFGSAVALSGSTALVGAPGNDDGVTGSGSAYVFVRSGNVWTQTKKLRASDAAANDQFGAAVSLAGAVALVGAPSRDNGLATDAGAAYTFQGSGSTWAEQTKLLPTSGAADHSGASVVVLGDTLLLGTDRVAGYVLSFYDFLAGVWAPGAGGVVATSPALAHAASALALSANYAVLGARTQDPSNAGSPGSVLVVRNSDHTAQFTLQANDGAAGDQFGSAVGISDTDSLLIGSAKDDDKGTDSGSVYVFTFAGTFTQQQKLTPSDGVAGDAFGSALALAGNSALIGAPSFGAKPGAAYLVGYGATNGSACVQNSECGTGFCVEKVCCNSACSGSCQSCLQKNKPNSGGGDGVCGNVRTGTDPLDACTADEANTCANSGVCDGKGACSLAGVGTSCTLSSCASATSATLNSACNGSGECKPVATVPCQLGYQCVAGVCKSGCKVNSDCDAALGFACTQTGECKQPKGAACNADSNCSTGTCQWGSCCLANADGTCIKPLGIDCTSDAECASGTCTDGLCCNSTCSGACESCALPASKGTCAETTCPGGNGGAGGDAGQAATGGQSGDAAGGNAAGGNAAGGNAAGGNAGLSEGGLGASAGFELGGGAGLAQGGVAAATGSAPGGSAGAAATSGAPPAVAGSAGHMNGSGNATTSADQRVMACGCRAAGQHGASHSALALLGTVGIALARRRKQRLGATER